MWRRIRAFLCCQQPQNVVTPIVSSIKRLNTHYLPTDIQVVSDQQRRKNLIQAYCCPICFLFYTKILACSECHNYVCRSCIEAMIKKADSNLQPVRCCFCGSETSMFKDENKIEKKVYFDASVPEWPKEKQQNHEGECESEIKKLRHQLSEPMQPHSSPHLDIPLEYHQPLSVQILRPQVLNVQ